MTRKQNIKYTSLETDASDIDRNSFNKDHTSKEVNGIG